jgi:MFS family permease
MILNVTKTPPASLGGSELRSGWPVVVGAALGFGMGPTVILFYTLSTFIAPLSQAFGWTRSQITSVTLLQLAATVVIVPYVGRLADRFGARQIAIGSLASSALCVLAFVAMKGSIWVFYAIWFTVVALGAGTSLNVWMRGVISRFDRQRGLAIGLTMLGSGACGAVAPPLADAAIRAGDWRTGYLMVAVAAGALGLPVVLMAFREAPRSRPVHRVAE